MGFPEGWTAQRVVEEKGKKKKRVVERNLRRNERLRLLGNAVVPQCGELIGLVAVGIAIWLRLLAPR